jgi:hypothetical protein
MNAHCIVLVLTTWSLIAAEPELVVPHLRHVNYLALQPTAPGKVGLECIQHGYRAYQDDLSARLLSQGEVTAKAAVKTGTSGMIAVPASTERVALEVNTGWNLGRVAPSAGLVYGYRAGVRKPLQTVREWGPLFFFVPEETRYFNLWFSASVRGEGLRYEVRDADGAIIRAEEGDFDKRTKVQILLKPGQAGTAWSVALLKTTEKGIYTDDVSFELGRHLPPFLAPEPEWAKQLAGNWRYDPKAPTAKNRVDARPATLPPWSGAKNPAVEAAYRRTSGAEWRTSLPFTYVLDYGSKHVGNADYVPTVATAPPTLLHLGKDVPFNHGWGPVKALGGENQAYGHGESIERLSPAEVGERIKQLTQMAGELHNAGARWLTPYICGMTVNGDPERRSGFWEFYDHWDEYRHLGLSPRPAADPLEWLQTKPDGTPAIYYGYKYPEEFYPPFKTNHRFAACWYTEGWRTWLLDVVRTTARCGFDGVFVDNGCSQRSTSTPALAAFRAFLKRRFTPRKARELLGVEDLDTVAFPGRKEGTVQLRSEQWRFWCETIRQEMAAIREAGSKALGRDFIVFPNGGRPHYIQEALRDCDFVMFEKSHGERGTHPGTVVDPVFEGVSLNSINDNIYEYRIVQSMRERVRPIILSRPGYPRSHPWLRLNTDAARLGMAECGAFSGGGGFLLRPRFDIYHDGLNEYRRFFETNPRLFAGLLPAANIGILAGLEQSERGNTTHASSLRSLARQLSDAHVLYEFVPERRQKSEQLKQYKTLVACDLASLSKARLDLVERFVAQGGRLLVTSPFATTDEYLRDRKAGFTTRIAALAPGAEFSHQKGSVQRLASLEDVPSQLPQAQLTCSNPKLAPGIRLNAWQTPADDRLVLHLVNYNVRLGVAPPATPKLGPVTIALPSAFPAKAAMLHLPGQKPRPLLCQAAGGKLTCEVPEFPIYAVIEFQ